MADPTNPDQLSDITFSSGLNADGTVAGTQTITNPDGTMTTTTTPSFSSWNGTYSSGKAVYPTGPADESKWYNDANGVAQAATSTAGTAGGTVTYAFGSEVTAAQQQAFISTMTLWSDEANITFKAASSNSTADVVYDVNTGGKSQNASEVQNSTVGSANIAAKAGPATPNSFQDNLTINNDGSYGTIGSYSLQGGYGIGNLTHEVGHLIGLGHAGPYNDSSADALQYQFNEFDSRQWSVMSYVSPDDPTAAFYSQYTVTGTNWQVTAPAGGGYYSITHASPETPMMDDIIAAQRLYGAPTSGALTQAQTFGFNCTITDATESYFDFNTNVNPVITLYDASTSGSTLDCSGFSTNCTINMNPGTFSSASNAYFDPSTGKNYTLTNNIGIAYGTKIDTAIGGSGDDTFTVNTDSDTINGGKGANTVDFAGARSAYTIATVPATALTPVMTTVINNTTQVVDTLTNIQSLVFSDQTVNVCYASGTAIRTLRPHGIAELPVEALAVGDLVVTASGEHRPIRWLGHRTVDCRAHPTPTAVWPVRIAAHAFGQGRPVRDLVVSPGHAICVDLQGDGAEVLIPASSLINGATVTQDEVDVVTYWHVELDSHDILLAEGLPAESYMDCGNRAWFAGGVGLVDPDRSVGSPDLFCRPFVTSGPIVAACRERLAAQAETLGWAATCDRDVYAMVDGDRLDPTVDGDLVCFLLPPGADMVEIVAATFRPAWWAGSDDRDLGLHLQSLRVLDGFGHTADIALDDPALAAWLHPQETGSGDPARWTGGQMTLGAHLWAHCRGHLFLQMRVTNTAGRRWIAPAARGTDGGTVVQLHAA